MKDVTILTSNGVNVEKSLELFGDMEMYDATLNDFLEDVDKKIEALKKYRESGDMPNYAIEVHALKSDARYLGFTVLAELAFNHEMAGKNNDLNYIYNNYDALINETKRIINVVNVYVGNPTQTVNTETKVVTDKKILVVDDSDIVTGFIKKIFANEYDVLIASDGASAIKYATEDTQNQIIGMFLDLNMPNVDGFQVLQYFSSNNLFDKIPVTIITGVDTKDEITKAYEYPIVDVLSKPFNEKNVKTSIEKMIERRQ